MKLAEAFAKKTYRTDYKDWVEEYGKKVAKEVYQFTNHEFREDEYKPWENYETARALSHDLEKAISRELERLYYHDERAQGGG